MADTGFDYEKATLKTLKKLAQNKDGDAAYELGNRYNLGKGRVKKNDEKLWYYINLAADNGNALALYLLGIVYFEDTEVRDLDRAKELFQAAANKGHNGASDYLAIMYYNGLGFKQDYKKAFTLSQATANQGNVAAQCNLGILYKEGKGVEKNLGSAAWCFMHAANGGDEDAVSQLKGLRDHLKHKIVSRFEDVLFSKNFSDALQALSQKAELPLAIERFLKSRAGAEHAPKI